ncbi:GCN5L1 family protein [Prunus dulcis]|uniref:GCN5L1 family protein n=1 Tax=Prunus dulcis TaxID=3755 RepID=A0A5H2XQE4_PRUDU|nr:GCN5L1 family protein [Prunus dulcis]
MGVLLRNQHNPLYESLLPNVFTGISSTGTCSRGILLLVRINPSDLEDSLLQLVQEHHHASLRIHNLTVIVAEKAQNEATKKAVCVAELLVEAVNNYGVHNLGLRVATSLLLDT